MTTTTDRAIMLPAVEQGTAALTPRHTDARTPLGGGDAMTVPLLFGPYGRGALDHVEQFAAHGANACWFHGFDAAAFEACERHGIAACVEFKTFRVDFAASPELVPV